MRERPGPSQPSRLARLGWTWLLCCIALLSWATGAQAAAAAPPALRLANADTHDLSGHLAMLRDPTGQLTLEAVLAAGEDAFKPLPGHLSAGFTSDAVWLRFVVARSDPKAPALWWLEIDKPMLESVTLYEHATGNRYHSRAGLPQGSDGIGGARFRVPVFELSLPEVGERVYYLRITSQTSLSAALRLWQPARLVESNGTESFAWGMVFGAYLLIIVFYGMFSLWTGESLHRTYTGYALVNFLAAFFTGAWPEDLWLPMDHEIATRLLGLWIALSLVVGPLFSARILNLHALWPGPVRWMLRGCYLVALLGAAGALGGYYRDVIPAVQGVSIALILVFLVLGVWQLLRGERSARLFLFGFSFFYMGVVWRYLRNIGLLEPSFWNDNSYQIGAFVHMLVMSVGMVSRYGSLRLEKEDADARAEAESRQRAEQRDFLAMVSHEFRTPLSILQASAHNLLADKSVLGPARERVHKMVRASDRMGALMDNYLSDERLLLEVPAPAAHDLARVCRLAADDVLDDTGPRIALRLPPALAARCDADMVRIAVANLLANARRHSPPQSQVELELSVRSGRAQIRVRDQGPGVPEDEIPRVFQRFIRGRGALDKPGAGLGLYLVRSIAQRHGGEVGVRNLPQGGCEFLISLPLSGPPAPPERA